jgi:hypothetical protein
MSASRTIGGLWLLLAIAGFVIWASAFAVLYGMQGLGCTLDLQSVMFLGSNVLTLTLAALWILHLGACVALLWYARSLWRPGPGVETQAKTFLAAVTCLVAATGAIATVYIGLPVLFLPPCN